MSGYLIVFRVTQGKRLTADFSIRPGVFENGPRRPVLIDG